MYSTPQQIFPFKQFKWFRFKLEFEMICCLLFSILKYMVEKRSLKHMP